MLAAAVLRSGFSIATRGRGFTEISDRVAAAVGASGMQTGLVNIFTRHTSCSLLVSENADPGVRGDLERWFARAVPDGDALFQHDAEGPDDMPAHIRAVLTGVSVSVPIGEGRLMLGTWQGIYLWEHRRQPHQRELVLTMLGM